MPSVVPLPLGGFATELGSQDERLRSIEANRGGAASSFVSGSVTVSSLAWTTPTGWPSVSLPPFSTGGALIVAACYFVGGANVYPQIGVSIDGAAPTVLLTGSGQTGDAVTGTVYPMFLVGATPLSLATHTFQLQAELLNPGSMVLQNPALVAVPF